MSSEQITRRNLPHWYFPGAAHFVTFRLAATLPREALDLLRQRKEEFLRQKRPRHVSPTQFRQRMHKQLFLEYDRYLDAGNGPKWLGVAAVAALLRRSIYFWHNKKYDLMAYSIMPNHVHLLVLPHDRGSEPQPGGEVVDIGECCDAKSPLASIMHSIKSYTAHRANRILRRSGEFWQHESYDHWVRDEEELERIVQYINANAVRAGLVQQAHDWYWCSAHDRYLTDGDTSGWLHFDPVP